MSKRYKRPPVNFQDFLDRKEREGTLPIEIGDKTFYVRSAVLLSDDEFTALMATEDPVEVGKIMMGEAHYNEFVAAGGSAAALAVIIQESESADGGDQGEDLGGSGASSTS